MKKSKKRKNLLKIERKIKECTKVRYEYPTLKQICYIKAVTAFTELYPEKPCWTPENTKIKAYLYTWCLENENPYSIEKQLIDRALAEIFCEEENEFNVESIQRYLRGYKNVKGTFLVPKLMKACNISITYEDKISNYDFCLKPIAKKRFCRKLKDMREFLKEYHASWDKNNISKYLDEINYKLECEDVYDDNEENEIEDIYQEIIQKAKQLYIRRPEVVSDIVEDIVDLIANK